MSKHSYFNPRSPCGERQNRYIRCDGPLAFQSTLPLRGATDKLREDLTAEIISIHAPLAGSDCRNGQIISEIKTEIHLCLSILLIIGREMTHLP